NAVDTTNAKDAGEAAEIAAAVLADAERRRREGLGLVGWRTGFKALDRVLRPMRPGQLVTVGAGSGCGKTSFALQITGNVAGEGASRPLRILDLASGGGDVAVGLALEARRAGVTVEIDGCDISPVAVTLAQAQACGAGLTQLRFFKHDVVRDELPGDYDVVTCSLFLHHLDEADAVRVMRKMAVSAQRLVLIDDLRRSPLGYALAWTGCRMLTRSPVAQTDGPRSVRAAFTLDEVARLADQAGLGGFRLSRHWPQRFLLSWSKL
ncbi:MAG: hypothetical protein B7Z73_07975, partial [Planctomycetia bacterium 21-64-5]